jgi:glutamate-1-semialdehyde 2,1-aminomutase
MDIFERSRQLGERSRNVIPGGVHSNVRLAERPVPLFFERANGPYVYDVDAHEYIDYVCGMGAIILGHNDPSVTSAVTNQLRRAELYGGQHEAEVELAERIVDLVPAVEMARFSLSGSEAVHAALRLSRAATGRRKVVKFEGHYHGWFDSQLVSTHPDLNAERAPGVGARESEGQLESVLDDLIVLPWNELEALERTVAGRDDVAAIIMEPIMCNSGVSFPRSGYLEGVRQFCDRHGVLLIFDEVITGFRVDLHGAQGLLNVKPDLTVLGKAVANGFPLSAVGGRRDVMALIGGGRVVHAGTFNGHPVSVAASLATVERLETDAGIYERMRRLGQTLIDNIVQIGRRHGLPLRAQGPGPVFFVWFTHSDPIFDYRTHAKANFDLYDIFSAELLREGVRVIPGGRWYLTASHTGVEVSRTLEAVERVCGRIHVNA